MPTGVSTADIISSAFGARHNAKMQELEGRQYMDKQRAANAKAKQDQRDKVFSRAIQLLPMTGDPAAAQQAAKTGILAGLPLAKKADERKREQQMIDNKQYADYIRSDEGRALLEKTYGDEIDIDKMADFVEQMGADRWQSDVWDVHQKNISNDLAQQRIDKSGAAKSPELLKWKFETLVKSDPVVQQKLLKIKELEANISANGQAMRGYNVSGNQVEALRAKINSDKKTLSKYQIELDDHVARLLDSEMKDGNYSTEPDFMEENFDLLFPGQ